MPWVHSLPSGSRLYESNSDGRNEAKHTRLFTVCEQHASFGKPVRDIHQGFTVRLYEGILLMHSFAGAWRGHDAGEAGRKTPRDDIRGAHEWLATSRACKRCAYPVLFARELLTAKDSDASYLHRWQTS